VNEKRDALRTRMVAGAIQVHAERIVVTRSGTSVRDQ
jgi:hypothetical protein